MIKQKIKIREKFLKYTSELRSFTALQNINKSPSSESPETRNLS